MYKCPKCSENLILSKQSYRCSNGHCFDLSAKGYVNLLISAKSGIHGDSKEMLTSRRAFLSRGYYYPIIVRLAEIIKAKCKNKNITLLDAGCGEGYYTDALKTFLENDGYDVNMYGIDVSKDGVAMASKRYKKCNFAVASVNALPFGKATFDVVVSLFAPIAETEFNRILKDDGMLITVSPSPRHLYGLKAAVYDNPYENEETTFVPTVLRAVGKSVFEDRVVLSSSEEISALFTMTPYYHKTDERGKMKIKALESLSTEIGFMFYSFEK